MLIATVSLWPFGDQSQEKRLVTIAVANVGVDRDSGGYNYVWTIDETTPLFGDPISAQGMIVGYDRKVPCVELLAEVMHVYKTDGSYTFAAGYYKDVVEKLRLKTKP
jgi:hypothetical protein